MSRHLWKDEADCLLIGLETALYFDRYEEDEGVRATVDSMCASCPVRKTCFANAVSGKEWGVWGGIYFEDGEISKEFNSHKTQDDWGATWKSLTMDL